MILSILALSALVISGHLIQGLDSTDLEFGIRNSLHILVFAVFSIIVFELFGHRNTTSAIGGTLLLILLVAALSEFAQSLGENRFDLFDLIRDILGATLALFGRLLWHRSRTKTGSSPIRFFRRFFAASLFAMIAAPLFYWLAAAALIRLSFPTIVDFGAWWGEHLYHPINSEAKLQTRAPTSAEDEEPAIQLRLTDWGRSGIGINPGVSNWSDFKYLTFIASMATGPHTTVTVRVNDSSRFHDFSDHFISTITISDEPTLIRLSLREMIVEPGRADIDLSDIREIVIFARDKGDATVLRLESVRLE